MENNGVLTTVAYCEDCRDLLPVGYNDAEVSATCPVCSETVRLFDARE